MPFKGQASMPVNRLRVIGHCSNKGALANNPMFCQRIGRCAGLFSPLAANSKRWAIVLLEQGPLTTVLDVCPRLVVVGICPMCANAREFCGDARAFSSPAPCALARLTRVLLPYCDAKAGADRFRNTVGQAPNGRAMRHYCVTPAPPQLQV